MGKVEATVLAALLLIMLAAATARNDISVDDGKCCADHHMPNCEVSQCIAYCAPCRDYQSSTCKVMSGLHYCHCKC